MSAKEAIGILTLHRAKSYGALLQCYALQKTIAALFPERKVGVIDFFPDLETVRKLSAAKKARRRHFQEFIEDNLTLLTEPGDTLPRCLDNQRDAGIADIVVGSDQVWNMDIVGTHLKDFLLGHPTVKCNKHAYAASFGMTPEVFDQRKGHGLFAEALQDFKDIGVREPSGRRICRALGRDDARFVLDPTLIADPAIYAPMTRPVAEKRICGFFLQKTGDMMANLRKLARFLRLPATQIILLCQRAPLLSRITGIRHPDFATFLSTVKQAEYVLTDSFHGVCFSIIFRKQFVVLPSGRKERFCRIEELLTACGLQQRIIPRHDPDSTIRQLTSPIDYRKVQERLTPLQKDSVRFLKDALARPVPV